MRSQAALHDYQRLAVEHLIEHPRANLFLGLGLGKTVSVLTAFEAARLAGEVDTMLVLAPLRVAQSVWTREPQEWQHLSHLRVQPIIGSKCERLAALERSADVYTINYENWLWLCEHLGRRMPFDWIVTDEATRLKKPSGKRFRAAKKRHKLPQRWTHLTGTPSPNGLKDLWAPNYLLDSGQRLMRTYSDFKTRWFVEDAYGYRLELRDGADAEIRNAISDITLTIRAEDYLDVREPVHHTVYADMPAQAWRVYRDLERQMLAELDSAEEVEAVSAAALTMKTRQVASGAVYTDDGSYEVVHDAKVEALQSIVEESGGEPLLVAYHFRSTADRLRRAFPAARLLDGEDVVDDWNRGDVPMLLAHPASAGHGLNLQHGGRILVFVDQDWDLELAQQIIERIGPTRQLQAGYDRQVYVYHIAARGTIDEDVQERQRGKADVQEALLAAMRRARDAPCPRCAVPAITCKKSQA